jgi:hypothetical protein
MVIGEWLRGAGGWRRCTIRQGACCELTVDGKGLQGICPRGWNHGSSSAASWDSFISQLILVHEHQFLFYFIDIMARTLSHKYRQEELFVAAQSNEASSQVLYQENTEHEKILSIS